VTSSQHKPQQPATGSKRPKKQFRANRLLHLRGRMRTMRLLDPFTPSRGYQEPASVGVEVPPATLHDPERPEESPGRTSLSNALRSRSGAGSGVPGGAMPQTHQSLHSPMSLDLSRRNVLPIYGDRTRTGHANQKSRRATAPRKVIGYVRATLMVSTRHHRLRSAECPR